MQWGREAAWESASLEIEAGHRCVAMLAWGAAVGAIRKALVGVLPTCILGSSLAVWVDMGDVVVS